MFKSEHFLDLSCRLHFLTSLWRRDAGPALLSSGDT